MKWYLLNWTGKHTTPKILLLRTGSGMSFTIYMNDGTNITKRYSTIEGMKNAPEKFKSELSTAIEKTPAEIGAIIGNIPKIDDILLMIYNGTNWCS